MRAFWILAFAAIILVPTSLLARGHAWDDVYDRIPYPNLVVGTITAVATPEQAEAIFASGRSRGLWSTLSPKPAEFAEKIQPVQMTLPSGKDVTVFMTADEYKSTPLHVGDFVRFSPHQPGYDKPRPGDPYWMAAGCVALLCASQDGTCVGQFKPGVYRVKDGSPLDDSGRHLVAGASAIDPVSMRPKASVAAPSPAVHST